MMTRIDQKLIETHGLIFALEETPVVLISEDELVVPAFRFHLVGGGKERVIMHALVYSEKKDSLERVFNLYYSRRFRRDYDDLRIGVALDLRAVVEERIGESFVTWPRRLATEVLGWERPKGFENYELPLWKTT